MPDLEATAGLDISDAKASVSDLATEIASELGAAFDLAIESFTASLASVDVSASLGAGFADAAAEAGDSLSGALAGAVATTEDELKTAIGTGAEEGAAELKSVTETTTAEVADDAQSKLSDAFSAAAQTFASEMANAGETAVEGITSATGGLGAVSDQIGQLGQETAGAGDKARSASGSFLQFEGATKLLRTGTQLMTGSTKAASESFGELSPSLGKAAGAAGGVAAAYAVLFGAGLRLQTAEDRLNIIFGDQAEKFKRIDVGGLSGDFDKLNVAVGSTGTGLSLTTANLGQFLIASGLSQEEAQGLAEKFDALVLKARALNPTLGDTGAAGQRLFTALITGRDRALVPFGLGITSAEIKTEALRLGLVKTGDVMTPFARVMAGISLAAQKAGNSLGTDFTKGAEQAANKAGALKAALELTIEKLGQPLVAPLLKFGELLVPIAEDVGKLVSSLLTGLLPVLQAAEPLLAATAEVMGAVAEAVSFLSPLLGPLATGFLIFEGVTRALPLVMDALAFSARTLIEVLPLTAAAAETAGAGIQAAEIGVAGALGPIGIVVGALGAAAVAFGLFGGSADDSAAQVQGFTDAVKEANGTLDDSVVKTAAALLKQRGELGNLAKAGITVNDVLKALSKTSGDTRGALENLGKTDTAHVLLGIGKTLDDVRGKLKDQDPELLRLLDRLQKAGQLTPELARTLLDLANKFRDGKISAKEFRQTVEDIAPATDTTTNALDATAQAVKDFASAATQAAPTVAGAFDTALSAAQSLAAGLPTADKAFDTTAKAFEAFGQHLTPDALAKGLQDQLDQVTTFSANLETLVSAGLLDLAGLIAKQGPEQAGGIAQQLAFQVAAGTPLVALALNNLVGEVNAGQDKLKNAVTADEFKAELDKELTNLREFTSNIQTLVDAGFTDLAQLLVTKGPVTGGGIAAQLAAGIKGGQPELAQELNGTTDQLAAQAQVYADTVTDLWGPQIVDAQTKALEKLAPAAKQTLQEQSELIKAAALAGQISANELPAPIDLPNPLKLLPGQIDDSKLQIETALAGAAVVLGLPFPGVPTPENPVAPLPQEILDTNEQLKIALAGSAVLLGLPLPVQTPVNPFADLPGQIAGSTTAVEAAVAAATAALGLPAPPAGPVNPFAELPAEIQGSVPAIDAAVLAASIALDIPPPKDPLADLPGQITASKAQVDAAISSLSFEGLAAFGEGFATLPAVAGKAVDDAGSEVTSSTPAVTGPAKQAGSEGAKAFGSGLSPEIQRQVQVAVGVAGTTFSSTVRFLLSALARGAGLGVGLSFGQGIVGGIKAETPAVEAAAAALVRAGEKAARKEAKSTSPSELFAAIGRDLVRGLVGGVNDETPGATRALSDVITALADPGVIAPIPVTVEPTVDQRPLAAPVPLTGQLVVPTPPPIQVELTPTLGPVPDAPVALNPSVDLTALPDLRVPVALDPGPLAAPPSPRVQVELTPQLGPVPDAPVTLVPAVDLAALPPLRAPVTLDPAPLELAALRLPVDLKAATPVSPVAPPAPIAAAQQNAPVTPILDTEKLRLQLADIFPKAWSVVENLHVETTNPNQVAVGIETAQQLGVAQFRGGR